jgi:glyoxylase I family protein
MDIKQLHHVAYRCKDARETTEFYTKVLGLEYEMALSEERVPSTGEEHPYLHVFFRMDDGSYVAFFELRDAPAMGRDANTPAWVQHLALRVADEEALLRNKRRIESHGVQVLGPVDHGICKSIYFFDPNGHRLELTVDCMTPQMKRELASTRDAMLDEWSRARK